MDGSVTKNPDLSPYLEGRSFESWFETFDQRGYVIFERVLSRSQVEAARAAVTPFLMAERVGRNDFEGYKTNRLNALLGKAPSLADLVIHPLALAFVEAELGSSCLLSALQAINLQPGEIAQRWHFDDGSITIPRPRPAYGVSAFWAIDDTTETNGATESNPRQPSLGR
jgi:ectoine hydroxylase-related dioxygenase (phytanoyl-CoA dioxygenase family)